MLSVILSKHQASYTRQLQPLILRHFSVKELSWCTPKANNKLVKKTQWSNRSPEECTSCQTTESRFSREQQNQNNKFGIGVIAAMDQNRVIGVNGSLPWNIKEDRKYFKSMTNNKILIIGKNTFYERGTERGDDFSHIEHCQSVIVVSTTMINDDLNKIRHIVKPNIHLVHSFEEAVQLSITLLEQEQKQEHKHSERIREKKKNEEKEIHCWIGGGQRIYEEAIRHSMVEELRLTQIKSPPNDNTTSSSSSSSSSSRSSNKEESDALLAKKERVAFFPAKYRYDNVFKEVTNQTQQREDDTQRNLSYSFHTYRRK